MKNSYDCVVIGAGPAGGTAAAIVAEAGHETLLIERESVPRFHVGESLMPEAYWPLERLGLVDRMKSSGWQQKKSVQFVTHTGKESEPFFFRDHDQRDCATTWQVERSEFDQMLFKRAEELGADCYDQTRLIDICFDRSGSMDDQPTATGIVVRDASGQQKTIDCKVVIDATGQQSFIAGKLGLKEINPDLKKAAIWTYYQNAVRGEGDNDGATIILNTENKNAWFWFIPQSRGITSIGCVADHEFLLKGRGSKGRGTPEEIFNEELQRCPGLLPRLKNATRVGKYSTAKEFSYMTRTHAGPGWVLVGDAFGFIDPVYSSGVYFALEMGVRAGDAVAEGLAGGDLGGAQLGKWAPDFKLGADRVRKLVHAFYDKDFSIGRFMKEYPQYRGNLTDLLIGRIFHEDAGQMFPDMQRSIEKSRLDKLQQSEMTA